MKRKGIGIGCMWYGIGNTGIANPAGAFLEVLPDGTVNVTSGCLEIGQGSTTVLSQIVAEELGVAYEDVLVFMGDTRYSPESGPTSASRQTVISGNAVRIAAREAKRKMIPVAAEMLAVPEEQLIFRNRNIFCEKNPEKCLSYKKLMQEMTKRGIQPIASGSYNPATMLDGTTMKGIPYESYSYATTIAQVEVDTETGCIELQKVVSAHDLGKAINPITAEGQIEGGVVMAQGYVYMEETLVENGVILNSNYSRYLIPTAKDAPEIYPILVEEPSSTGPYGAKGLGEPALIAAIAAMVDAIEDAIGVRFCELPIRPEDVLRKYQEKEHLN